MQNSIYHWVKVIACVAGCWNGLLTGAAQNPIAWYTFDNTPNDQSGNKNNGVIHGSVMPSMDRYGNPCGAYHFDGLTGYIEVPSSSSLESPSGSITLATWFRFNNRRTNYWLTVACKGMDKGERDDNPQYRMQIQQDFLTGAFAHCSAGGNGFGTISLNTEFTGCDKDFRQHLFEPFIWNHFALVYDGGNITAYLNGEVIYKTAYSKPLVKNALPLFIGKDEPGATEFFEGDLDDLYIFDGPLDASAISKLYKKQHSSNWGMEEFEVNLPVDLRLKIPRNETGVTARWEPPKVRNNTCGDVIITQILGPSPGSNFTEGRHLIMYNLTSATGYQRNIGFYVYADRVPGDSSLSDTKQRPPDYLNGRETIEQESLVVDSTNLRLVIYDNATYDGDTVSIFLNNKPIIQKQEVTTAGFQRIITIDPAIDNQLVMFAENLGSIPPNTALLVLYEGDKKYEIHLSSTLQQNAMIRIKKRIK